MATAPPIMTGVLVRSIFTPLRQAEVGIVPSGRFQKESEVYYRFTNKLRAGAPQVLGSYLTELLAKVVAAWIEDIR